MNYTFEEVFTYENLYNSYKICRKGVSWKSSVQTYKANACVNVRKTQTELLNGTWKSKGFIDFDIAERGKTRHIRSVHISERVVQRCLCDYALVPLFGQSLIPDNSASQKGKGIDYALNRLTVHLRQHYREHGTDGFVLLCDFHNFFGSIDHDYAKTMLRRYITDDRLYDLTAYLIDQFGDVGLGLGSQISQILALAVPNRMDHRIKEELHIKRYGRYMDDFYLIHKDKEYLRKCLDVIKEEAAKFGVSINEKKTQIVKLSRGFRFLKTRFILTDTGKVIRKINKSNISRQRRKMKKLANKLPPDAIKASAQSFNGHASRCNSYYTRQNMDKVLRYCMKKATKNTETARQKPERTNKEVTQ